MLILNTALTDVKLIQPKRFGDSRGWFTEVFDPRDIMAAMALLEELDTGLDRLHAPS